MAGTPALHISIIAIPGLLAIIIYILTKKALRQEAPGPFILFGSLMFLDRSCCVAARAAAAASGTSAAFFLCLNHEPHNQKNDGNKDNKYHCRWNIHKLTLSDEALPQWLASSNLIIG